MIKAIHERNDDASGPEADFAAFVLIVEPRLRRALAGAVGIDKAPDAVAEALAYAWENWDRVAAMSNAAGYLYRVAQSASRVRLPTQVRYLIVEPTTMPDVEPALLDAVHALPARQRAVVWLVYACEWSYAEVAEALGISASAIGTHASRGLATLRSEIGAAHG